VSERMRTAYGQSFGDVRGKGRGGRRCKRLAQTLRQKDKVHLLFWHMYVLLRYDFSELLAGGSLIFFGGSKNGKTGSMDQNG